MDYISIKMHMTFKIRARGLGLMQLGILLNLECLRKSLWYETAQTQQGAPGPVSFTDAKGHFSWKVSFKLSQDLI